MRKQLETFKRHKLMHEGLAVTDWSLIHIWPFIATSLDGVINCNRHENGFRNYTHRNETVKEVTSHDSNFCLEGSLCLHCNDDHPDTDVCL